MVRIQELFFANFALVRGFPRVHSHVSIKNTVLNEAFSTRLAQIVFDSIVDFLVSAQRSPSLKFLVANITLKRFIRRMCLEMFGQTVAVGVGLATSGT